MQAPLPLPVHATDRVDRPVPALRAEFRARTHLWLCLHFKNLPLDALGADENRPASVCIEQQNKLRVLVCNRAASDFGVRNGLPANAALALAPDLDVLPRDPAAEARLLKRLACVATRFTPAVSLEAPDALLLEVQGSLKLFGGLVRLREQVLAAFGVHGYRVDCAVAPTASAALWLARAGVDVTIRNRTGLAGRLAKLPLDCLRWPDKVCIALGRMGVRTLGECVRLPRDGLARRIGPKLLTELDRGFGKLPEPRFFYVPPERFADTLELPAESVDVEQLLSVLQVLLDRLDRFLVRRQAAIHTVWLRLHHHDLPPTILRIGLLRAATDTAYLMELARIRCDGMRFRAPVMALSIQSDAAAVAAQNDRDLFGAMPDDAGRSIELLERLRMRLGLQAVFGLRAVPEHRPESAWASVTEPGHCGATTGVCQLAAERPVWMLAEPVRLKAVGGRPVYREVLDLERSPERIETGWWDGDDVRRDYYVARDGRGARLWVYRDCRESAWYLHGLFG